MTSDSFDPKAQAVEATELVNSTCNELSKGPQCMWIDWHVIVRAALAEAWAHGNECGWDGQYPANPFIFNDAPPCA